MLIFTALNRFGRGAAVEPFEGSCVRVGREELRAEDASPFGPAVGFALKDSLLEIGSPAGDSGEGFAGDLLAAAS